MTAYNFDSKSWMSEKLLDLGAVIDQQAFLSTVHQEFDEPKLTLKAMNMLHRNLTLNLDQLSFIGFEVLRTFILENAITDMA